MGTMTLANLRAELLFDLKNRSDTTTADGFTVTRQNMFLNAGYLHMTHPSVFRHREMMYSFVLTLVSGTHTYTFSPVSGVTITGIRYVSNVVAATDNPTAPRTKLLPVDEQWFQERTSQSGAPRNYAVRGDQILLSPVPGVNEAGEVIVVGAWREPALLSADGDTTVLSSRFDEIVLLAGLWRAQLHLGYREMAEATKLDFTSLVNEYHDFERLHGEDWDWTVAVRTESPMERA